MQTKNPLCVIVEGQSSTARKDFATQLMPNILSVVQISAQALAYDIVGQFISTIVLYAMSSETRDVKFLIK